MRARTDCGQNGSGRTDAGQNDAGQNQSKPEPMRPERMRAQNRSEPEPIRARTVLDGSRSQRTGSWTLERIRAGAPALIGEVNAILGVSEDDLRILGTMSRG